MIKKVCRKLKTTKKKINLPDLHLHMEDGQSQVLTPGLTEKSGCLPCRRFSPASLAEVVDGVGCSQVEGMLAVLFPQEVGCRIDFLDFFDLYRAFKEGVLNISIFHQVQEDNTRCPVDHIMFVDRFKEFLHQAGEFHGVGGGAEELCLYARD